MAERHTIETYSRAPHNRNIWSSRLADSFVFHAAFIPLLRLQSEKGQRHSSTRFSLPQHRIYSRLKPYDVYLCACLCVYVFVCASVCCLSKDRTPFCSTNRRGSSNRLMLPPLFLLLLLLLQQMALLLGNDYLWI